MYAPTAGWTENVRVCYASTDGVVIISSNTLTTGSSWDPPTRSYQNEPAPQFVPCRRPPRRWFPPHRPDVDPWVPARVVARAPVVVWPAMLRRFRGDA